MNLHSRVDALKQVVKPLSEYKTRRVARTVQELRGLLDEVSLQRQGALTRLCRFILAQKDYLFCNGRNAPKTVTAVLANLSEEHRRYFDRYLNMYAPLLRGAIFEEHHDTWKAWIRLLKHFSEWVRTAAIGELGFVSFDDMIRMAIGVLERNPEVQRSEYERIRTLLVDEFQDTDPDQLRLLATLLRKPTQGEHEVLCFFVGDTKQSIYRFRGVDIRSVQDFFQRFESTTGCIKKKREFHLQTNFRSTETIARFVNHLFSEQFQLTGQSDRLIAFRDSRGALPEWVSPVEESEEKLTSSSSRREQAARASVKIVLDYMRDSDHKSHRYSDVLILVRDRRDLDALLPFLHQAGIPVRIARCCRLSTAKPPGVG